MLGGVVLVVLVAVVVVVLGVAWLSDRRDRAGGAGRHRSPGAMRTDATRVRKDAQWQRAASHRWMSRMGPFER